MHHQQATLAVSLLHVRELFVRRVYEHHIGVAPSADGQRRAGPDGGRPQPVGRAFLEVGGKNIKQP